MISRLTLLALLVAGPAVAADRWWDDAVEQALAKAKDNRGELEKALADVPKDQRKGMAFLVANMPDADLKSLKAEFLLTNTALAYKARKEVPWGKDVPEDVCQQYDEARRQGTLPAHEFVFQGFQQF